MWRARYREPTAKGHARGDSAIERLPARYPSSRRPGWRFSSLRRPFSAEREFWLFALDQPLNVGVVLINNEDRGQQRANTDHQRRRVVRRPQEIDEQRHCRGRGNRRKRNVAPERDHQGEDNDAAEHGRRAQGEKNARSRRYSFSAAKI